MFKACIGLNCARQIDYLDRRHCNLTRIPEEVWRNEQYLEELLMDMNGLQDLPPKFFRITNLRKLTVSENELLRLSPMVSNLLRLMELDISKNAIEEIPENIRQCRCLSILDISSNPLLKVPECLTMIKTLTILCMNDCSLPRLPTEIGSLENLQVLEARENLLKSIPRSIGHLRKLIRLDLGNNEIEELPPEIGSLESLEELWLDSNTLRELPEEIGRLSNLESADITKNKLEFLPSSIEHLTNLKDLHVSENYLTTVPETIGAMKRLLSLKLDMNRLLDIPESIGGLTSLTELALYENMLDAIPSSLFHIPTLDMLDLGRNHIVELPPAVGQCKKLHILSLYDNMLSTIPDEVGDLLELKVLNISGNRLAHLPLSFKKLELDALWLDGNQMQPLIPLRAEPDPSDVSRQVLLCSALPQKSSEENSLVSDIEERSLHRKHDPDSKMVAFPPDVTGKNDSFRYGKLVRFPTPRRPSKGDKKKKYKPDLSRPAGTPIIKKLKEDEMTEEGEDGEQESITDLTPVIEDAEEQPLPRYKPIRKRVDVVPGATVAGQRTAAVDLTESAQDKGQQLTDATPDLLRTAGGMLMTGTPSLGPSTLQTVEVAVELHKLPDKGLGFSIAGGKGSTPAYEDVDESIFITKVAPNGIAEKDGRLRLGDKLISVNGLNMLGSSHQQAVAALKEVSTSCLLMVSREVLVVMPSSVTTPSPVPPESATATTSVHEGSPPGGRSVAKETTTTTARSMEDVREFGAKISALSQERPLVCDPQPSPRPGEGTPPSARSRHPSDPASSDRKQGQSSSSLRTEEPAMTEEEAEQVLIGLKEEVVEREAEGFVSLDPGAEPLPPAPPTSASRPKKSGDYANLELSHLIEANNRAYVESDGESDGEGERMEKIAGVRVDPLVDSSGSSGSSDDDSDSDSDSGSDVVVMRPKAPVLPQFPEEDVILNRGSGLLGLKIVGGADHTCKPFGNGTPGIFVSKVTPGGAAAASGKLRVGDRILEVNGSDVRAATHDRAVSLLIERRERIALRVQHEPPPPGLREITLTKGLNDKLGLSIRGGSKRGECEEEDTGIYISKVISGGAAAKDGRLQMGQRILEVNNQSLLGAAHMDAVRSLKNVQEKLTILVCDGLEPEELERNMPVSKKAGSTSLAASQEELLAIEQSEKEINTMLSELGSMEAEANHVREEEEEEEDRLSQKGRVLRSPSGTFELSPEASHHLATVHEKMEQMKESLEKEEQAHFEKREQLKREQSEKDLTKLKEIEQLEKQAEAAEEKSMKLKEQVRRKSELTEKKIFEDASRLEELRKKEHEKRLDRAARSASTEHKPSTSSEVPGSGGLAQVQPEEEVFVAPEAPLESSPAVANWEGEVKGKGPEQSDDDSKPEAPTDGSPAPASSRPSSITISSSGSTINVALKPTATTTTTTSTAAATATTTATATGKPQKDADKPLDSSRIRKGVDNRPLGSLKDRMAAFQNGKEGEASSMTESKSFEKIANSGTPLESNVKNEKTSRKPSPPEAIVTISVVKATKAQQPSEQESRSKEREENSEETETLPTDSKLQKEMERIERSIKMASKRVNGQEKPEEGPPVGTGQ